MSKFIYLKPFADPFFVNRLTLTVRYIDGRTTQLRRSSFSDDDLLIIEKLFNKEK